MPRRPAGGLLPHWAVGLLLPFLLPACRATALAAVSRAWRRVVLRYAGRFVHASVAGAEPRHVLLAALRQGGFAFPVPMPVGLAQRPPSSAVWGNAPARPGAEVALALARSALAPGSGLGFAAVLDDGTLLCAPRGPARPDRFEVLGSIGIARVDAAGPGALRVAYYGPAASFPRKELVVPVAAPFRPDRTVPLFCGERLAGVVVSFEDRHWSVLEFEHADDDLVALTDPGCAELYASGTDPAGRRGRPARFGPACCGVLVSGRRGTQVAALVALDARSGRLRVRHGRADARWFPRLWGEIDPDPAPDPAWPCPASDPARDGLPPAFAHCQRTVLAVAEN